jgi:hypothetical protein
MRDQGAMLGHGQVWFGADGKVIALHNPDPGATAALPAAAPQAASDDPPLLAALRKGSKRPGNSS